jgi:peptidoglycan hydrolase-like protein with peptidoglycan-binding domain
LLYGDIGPRVTALQEALVSTGFLEDVADGQYGPATIKAVMNFQFSQNIPVDGIAGPNTHALLGIAYP